MGVLEEITQMKEDGIPDEEISKKLQDQGISPKAVNDAFNQADIKNAVSNKGPLEGEEFEGFQTPQPGGQSGTYAPKSQEIPESETYSPQPEGQEYVPQQEGYDYPSQGIDTSTIIEISEQVFFEKIQKIQKQVEEISEFKAITESKIENISERVKKIETIIDKLQITILEKVGSYGNNLESIKKEMSMMQNSFGKIVGNATKKRSPKKDETFSKLKRISKKK
jgi:hypothetical protein